MRQSLAFTFLSGLHAAFAQKADSSTQEVHPKLPFQQCTQSGCKDLSTSVVLDANWRGAASGDALYGVSDYKAKYGIATSDNAITMAFKAGDGFGSRVYLLADDNKYQMFKPKNQELSVDIDASKLPCGIVGALYFSQMEEDAGMSKYSGNQAGPAYGTGYCDAQCPKDIKYINGEANSGSSGACCTELDLFEGNTAAHSFTTHACSVDELTKCSGDNCNICDKDGCDFNGWRMGDRSFYGKGLTLDSSSKFTMVTQFITADGTSSGQLSEIRRKYVQNGKVINNSAVKVPGVEGNSLSDNYCTAQKQAFGAENDHAAKGGMSGMGKAMDAGMVLVMSIWDDKSQQALWLDSIFPKGADPNTPGASRGPCPTTSGQPADVQSQYPDAAITYSNIRFGDIDSTYQGSGNGTNGNGTSSGSTGGSTGGNSTDGSTGGSTGWNTTNPSTTSSSYLPGPTGGSTGGPTGGSTGSGSTDGSTGSGQYYPSPQNGGDNGYADGGQGGSGGEDESGGEAGSGGDDECPT